MAQATTSKGRSGLTDSMGHCLYAPAAGSYDDLIRDAGRGLEEIGPADLPDADYGRLPNRAMGKRVKVLASPTRDAHAYSDPIQSVASPPRDARADSDPIRSVASPGRRDRVYFERPFAA